MSAQHQAEPHVTGEHAHPSALRYVQIAVILSVITATEVAVYYVPAVAGALIPVLLTLSALKFSLVVMWYMHLKFDNRIFTAIFVGGLLLAGAVLIALLFLSISPALLGGPPQE